MAKEKVKLSCYNYFDECEGIVHPKGLDKAAKEDFIFTAMDEAVSSVLDLRSMARK